MLIHFVYNIIILNDKSEYAAIFAHTIETGSTHTISSEPTELTDEVLSAFIYHVPIRIKESFIRSVNGYFDASGDFDLNDWQAQTNHRHLVGFTGELHVEMLKTYLKCNQPPLATVYKTAYHTKIGEVNMQFNFHDCTKEGFKGINPARRKKRRISFAKEK